MSPEIIDVQTNRRCGRTREFGRLLKKESKREEGGGGGKWLKMMRQRREESEETRRKVEKLEGGILSFS